MGSKEPLELLALKKHLERLAKDIHLIPKISYEGLRSQVEDSCRESMAGLPKSLIGRCTEKIFNDLRRFLYLNSSDETSVISTLSQDSAMKIGNNLLNITVLVDKLSIDWHNKVTPEIFDLEKTEHVSQTTKKALSASENNNNATKSEELLDDQLKNETKEKITVNFDSNGEAILNLSEIHELPENNDVEKILQNQSHMVQKDEDFHFETEENLDDSMASVIMEEGPPLQMSTGASPLAAAGATSTPRQEPSSAASVSGPAGVSESPEVLGSPSLAASGSPPRIVSPVVAGLPATFGSLVVPEVVETPAIVSSPADSGSETGVEVTPNEAEGFSGADDEAGAGDSSNLHKCRHPSCNRIFQVLAKFIHLQCVPILPSNFEYSAYYSKAVVLQTFSPCFCNLDCSLCRLAENLLTIHNFHGTQEKGLLFLQFLNEFDSFKVFLFFYSNSFA